MKDNLPELTFVQKKLKEEWKIILFHPAFETQYKIVAGSVAMKVLFADDSAVMRKIIRRLLEEVGVTSITETANGEEALKAFQSDQFDLLLLDWNMPNKSGLEVVREVRASGATVPIIMITTESEKDRIAEAIFAGASDYLVKPFDQNKLRTILNNHVANGDNESSGAWHPQFVSHSTPKNKWGKRIS